MLEQLSDTQTLFLGIVVLGVGYAIFASILWALDSRNLAARKHRT